MLSSIGSCLTAVLDVFVISSVSWQVTWAWWSMIVIVFITFWHVFAPLSCALVPNILYNIFVITSSNLEAVLTGSFLAVVLTNYGLEVVPIESVISVPGWTIVFWWTMVITWYNRWATFLWWSTLIWWSTLFWWSMWFTWSMVFTWYDWSLLSRGWTSRIVPRIYNSKT